MTGNHCGPESGYACSNSGSSVPADHFEAAGWKHRRLVVPGRAGQLRQQAAAKLVQHPLRHVRGDEPARRRLRSRLGLLVQRPQRRQVRRLGGQLQPEAGREHGRVECIAGRTGVRCVVVPSSGTGGYVVFDANATVTSGTVDLLQLFNYAVAHNWLPANSTVNQLGFRGRRSVRPTGRPPRWCRRELLDHFELTPPSRPSGARHEVRLDVHRDRSFPVPTRRAREARCRRGRRPRRRSGLSPLPGSPPRCPIAACPCRIRQPRVSLCGPSPRCAVRDSIAFRGTSRAHRAPVAVLAGLSTWCRFPPRPARVAPGDTVSPPRPATRHAGSRTVAPRERRSAHFRSIRRAARGEAGGDMPVSPSVASGRQRATCEATSSEQPAGRRQEAACLAPRRPWIASAERHRFPDPCEH